MSLWLHLLIVCPTCAYVRAHLWSPEKSGHELVPSTMSIPGIELRLPSRAEPLPNAILRTLISCHAGVCHLTSGGWQTLLFVVVGIESGVLGRISVRDFPPIGPPPQCQTTPVPDAPLVSEAAPCWPQIQDSSTFFEHWVYANTPLFLPWLTFPIHASVSWPKLPHTSGMWGFRNSLLPEFNLTTVSQTASHTISHHACFMH